jgi:hypothetical protein
VLEEIVVQRDKAITAPHAGRGPSAQWQWSLKAGIDEVAPLRNRPGEVKKFRFTVRPGKSYSTT